MGMFFHSSDAPAERPADPAVRRANLRRIGPLFTPYWRRLSGLLGLIVLTAGLGVVPAFLLRRVLNAIVHHDKAAISWNAGGMIPTAIVTGVLGSIQARLSNQVRPRRPLPRRAGVALGERDPARQDHGPLARARRPVRVGVAEPRRPRGAPADGGTLGDGVDPDELRDHARGGVLGRRPHERRLHRD